MPRISDEKKGASLIAARRAIVAERGDVPGVGFLLVLRHLAAGHGEAGDVETTISDMTLMVAKHALDKDVEPASVLQELEHPARPRDDGSVAGGAAAVLDALRTSCRTSGIDFDEVLGRAMRNLDAETARPGP